MRLLPVALLAVLCFVPTAAARDPVDHSQPPAPDGTPICAAWVHERYTVERGGLRWPTWHPPRDQRYHCAFGHEHGSNPRAFRYFGRTGMPAFGPVGAYAGSEEPHAAFKVFVANEDRKALAWTVVLHQGTGSPRRGLVRFHSLEAWLFYNRGRRLAAHVRTMADFGEAVPNCPGTKLAPRMRLLPDPGCESVYERWSTRLDLGGVFGAEPAFAVDNPITQFDAADPQRVVFNKRIACGPNDPGGWDSYCKGDKRTLLHPRWTLNNPGRSRFRTDAYGRRAPNGLLQVVSRRLRIRQAGECCGAENAFIMERPSDGGLYRADRGLNSSNFEWPGYCVLGTN